MSKDTAAIPVLNHIPKVPAGYVRCKSCEIAFHKDGHEKILWCYKFDCPKTKQRYPTEAQRRVLLGERKVEE